MCKPLSYSKESHIDDNDNPIYPDYCQIAIVGKEFWDKNKHLDDTFTEYDLPEGFSESSENIFEYSKPDLSPGTYEDAAKALKDFGYTEIETPLQW